MTQDDLLGRVFRVAKGVGSGVNFTVISIDPAEQRAVVHDSQGARQRLVLPKLLDAVHAGYVVEVAVAPFSHAHPLEVR